MKTVEKLWFDGDRIFIKTTKGEVLSQPLRFFPRLRSSSHSQRAGWRESPLGIHWDKVDEDVSFESFTWSDADPHSLYHNG